MRSWNYLNRSNGWILGILCGLLALFRHNGVTVAFGSLILFGLLYPRKWKSFGFKPTSLLPGLVKPFTDAIWESIRLRFSWFFWRPALWMFGAILAGLAWAIVGKQWRRLTILIPIAIQAVTMFLLVNSQEARFHYPIYLTSIYLILYIGLYFVAQVGKPNAALDLRLE